MLLVVRTEWNSGVHGSYPLARGRIQHQHSTGKDRVRLDAVDHAKPFQQRVGSQL
jgi:hypothetical protein